MRKEEILVLREFNVVKDYNVALLEQEVGSEAVSSDLLNKVK